MVNKLQDPAKKKGISKFFKSVVLTGTTLLLLLQPGYSKNNDKVKSAIKEVLEEYDAKAYQIQEDKTNNKTYDFNQGAEMMDGGNDAFDFAINNVDKYYPDMKKHLEDMIKQFGTDTERKEVVSKIFDETFMGIADPKQRIGAIIYALEGYIIVLGGSDFSDKYDSDITTETYLVMEKAEKKYETRLKNWLIDIENIHAEIKQHRQELEQNIKELEQNKKELEQNKKELEQNKKELEQNKKELEQNKKELEQSKKELEQSKKELAKTNQQLTDILNKISSQDVKNNERIRDMVIEAKALFFKYGKEINPHIDELFTLVP